jgi:exonuclease SbcC
MVYLHKIVELEEYRLKLEDGKACPLCGALEHPFALGNVPVPDELEDTITALTKIITDAEDLETGLEALASQERDASTALSDQKQQESAAIHAKESAAAVCRDERSTSTETYPLWYF